MPLSRQAIAAIVLSVNVSACQGASLRAMPHVTQANISLSSTLSALPRISAASSDGQATELFVDPGTEFAMEGMSTVSDNPNRRACDAALRQLANDQNQLRRTNEWQSMMTSPAYVAMIHGIKQVRHDNCHTPISASPQCQAEFESLNATVTALWKSPEYQALEQTSEYAVLQNDASSISRVGNLWRHCSELHSSPSPSRSVTTNASTVMAKYDTSRPAWQWQTKTTSYQGVSAHHQRAALARVIEARHPVRRHRHDHNRGYGK